AEDGIRDFHVTGVQTCALPILELNDLQRLDQMMITAVLAPSLNFSNYRHQHTISGSLTYTNLDDQNPSTKDQTNGNNISASLNRSEERRVRKEYRYRR